jgi:hypothetical protein
VGKGPTQVRWSCHWHSQEGSAAVLLVIGEWLEGVHCQGKHQQQAIVVWEIHQVLLEGDPILDITDVAITCSQ